MPIKIPITITDDKDKLKFFYRVVELLRLEHNEKGKDFRENKILERDFRNYQKYDFEPRNQRLFFEINQLKEKLDLFKRYGDIKNPSPNLVEAQKISKEGKEATKFDKDINLTEI